MRSDWIISGSGHAVLLLLGLVSLATSKPRNDLADYVPVSIVTDADISRAAIGQKNVPKPDKPKPLADKVGALKQVEQVAPKVVNKPAITTSAAAPAPPKPQAQKAAEKPQPKSQQTAQPKPPPQPQDEAQQKPEQKPQQNPKAAAAQKPQPKPAPFKADRIADLLKKTHSSPPHQKPAPRMPRMPRYSADQIAQLLDHRAPQRQVATASARNSRASLGAATAPDAQLSQSEIDALRERLRQCWSPPPGINGNTNIYVSLRVLFKPNGALAQAPVVVAGSPSPLGPALAESGKRALLLCQPFTMLRPEHYAQWRDMTVDFDPRDLAGD